MKCTIYILPFVFCLIGNSCNRIENKGSEIKEIAEQKVKDKSKDIAEKLIPHFDSYTPDTKYNKERFKEYLQVDLTNDIKEIYSYGDFLGADYKVLIAFTCEEQTINKIIKVKQMQMANIKDDSGLIFGEEFKWWDKNEIEKLEPYKEGKENKYWQYLWYNIKSRRAFYEAFSL